MKLLLLDKPQPWPKSSPFGVSIIQQTPLPDILMTCRAN